MTILEAGLATEHNHEGEKIDAFEEGQGIMAKVAEMGFAGYAETLPDLAEAFDL